jgi:regulator of ribonuclease activity A
VTTHPVSQSDSPATADLYDKHGESLQSCDLQLRHYGAVSAFSGAITTVKCFEDNALLKSILGEDGTGRVLVVDGDGSLHTALMGDMIAKIAVSNKWAGVIINGAVRDTAILAELPIGLKALGSNPARAQRPARANVMFPWSSEAPGSNPGPCSTAAMRTA